MRAGLALAKRREQLITAGKNTDCKTSWHSWQDVFKNVLCLVDPPGAPNDPSNPNWQCYKMRLYAVSRLKSLLKVVETHVAKPRKSDESSMKQKIQGEERWPQGWSEANHLEDVWTLSTWPSTRIGKAKQGAKKEFSLCLLDYQSDCFNSKRCLGSKTKSIISGVDEIEIWNMICNNSDYIRVSKKNSFYCKNCWKLLENRHNATPQYSLSKLLSPNPYIPFFYSTCTLKALLHMLPL